MFDTKNTKFSNKHEIFKAGIEIQVYNDDKHLVVSGFLV